jgi:hypothetical protein
LLEKEREALKWTAFAPTWRQVESLLETPSEALR